MFSTGVGENLIRLMKSLYDNTTIRVHIKIKENSAEVDITQPFFRV
ncbi:unnamed protein product [Nezara viridula]|uniref:Uncharacterized protein n=1 Tax=Nezara viridula TaxID=85310 RepID=A0A9P0MPR8_NEZVI|nr:unnamed protein product [Nezara viridula]